MNFAEAEQAVREFFETGWASLTPIAWPDVSYQPGDVTWVRFVMTNNIGTQASTGGLTNRFRRRGIVAIQVFAPEGDAGRDAAAKADTAADIFLANNLDGITFQNINAKQIGSDGSGWYQWNVTAEYYYDRIL